MTAPTRREAEADEILTDAWRKLHAAVVEYFETVRDPGYVDVEALADEALEALAAGALL